MWSRTMNGSAQRHWLTVALMSIAVISQQPATAQSAPQSSGAKSSKRTAQTAAPKRGTPAAAAATGSASMLSGLTKEQCQHYVDVLAGKAKEPAVLQEPATRELATRVPDLVTCGAVATDNGELCKVLGEGINRDSPYLNCREQQAMLHELREFPNGRSFFFTDVEIEQCEQFGPTKQYCKLIRDIARSGDASKCGSLGFLADTCRAFLGVDKSLCKAPAGSEFAAAMQGQPPSAQKQVASGIQEDCVKKIESRGFMAKGLNDIAASNRPEGKLAKAALGQADACASDIGAATAACAKMVQQSGGSAPPAQAPATPGAPGAPAGGAPETPGAANQPAPAPAGQQ